MIVSRQTLGCVLCAIALLVVGVATVNSRPARAEVAVQADAKLKGLSEDRLDILREISAQIAEQVKAGQSSMTEAMDAKRAVTQAQLEMSTSDVERMAFSKELVAHAKEVEKFWSEQVAAGEASPLTLLKARASRMEAEIALARLRQK